MGDERSPSSSAAETLPQEARARRISISDTSGGSDCVSARGTELCSRKTASAAPAHGASSGPPEAKYLRATASQCRFPWRCTCMRNGELSVSRHIAQRRSPAGGSSSAATARSARTHSLRCRGARFNAAGSVLASFCVSCTTKSMRGSSMPWARADVAPSSAQPRLILSVPQLHRPRSTTAVAASRRKSAHASSVARRPRPQPALMASM
eukprot:scaffold323803_cov31-Tisochrysis_lutea.AAC.3